MPITDPPPPPPCPFPWQTEKALSTPQAKGCSPQRRALPSSHRCRPTLGRGHRTPNPHRQAFLRNKAVDRTCARVLSQRMLRLDDRHEGSGCRRCSLQPLPHEVVNDERPSRSATSHAAKASTRQNKTGTGCAPKILCSLKRETIHVTTRRARSVHRLSSAMNPRWPSTIDTAASGDSEVKYRLNCLEAWLILCYIYTSYIYNVKWPQRGR